MENQHEIIARERAEREAEIAERQREQAEIARRTEAAVQERLERLRINHEATKRLNSEITRQRTFELPPPGWTAEDFVAESEEPLHAVIQGLHYEGNNTLLVAEYKTGKTTLEINLAGALADNKPFLGRFDTALTRGRIAFFNYEMGKDQFRLWLNESDIENIDRIVPLNLRGWTLPFWDEGELLRLAEWLNKNEVTFIILDPASKAWRGLIDNESDNVQLAEFFGAIDTLKEAAGVPNLMLSVHTPRDAERARGGGEIEAWPDANWYLSKMKGTKHRSIRAEGRDVDLDDTVLEYDSDSRTLRAGGEASKLEDDVGCAAAVAAIEGAGGEFPSLKAFMAALAGQHGNKRRMVHVAVERGLIEEREDAGTKLYKIVKKGEE